MRKLLGMAALAICCGQGIASGVLPEERIVFQDDFASQSNWGKTLAYQDRVKLEFGSAYDGFSGLRVHGATSRCDTAWYVETKKLYLPDGAKSFRMSFRTDAERHIVAEADHDNQFYPKATWYGANGDVVKVEGLTFCVPAGYSEAKFIGPIPKDAKSVIIRIGFDRPDVCGDFSKGPAVGSSIRIGKFVFAVSGSDGPVRTIYDYKRFPLNVPKTTLRDDGMTLVDGKPFFPIGIYGLAKHERNGYNWDNMFRELGEIGLNFGLSYAERHSSELMKAAERNGFKLFVHAKMPDYQFWRDARHPAVLAWYIGDDTSTHISPEELLAYHTAIKLADPNRITSQADHEWSYAPTAGRNTLYVNAADNFQPELYPIRYNSAKEMSNCVAEVVRDMRGCFNDIRRFGDGKPKSVWPIVQYFRGWGWKRFPSEQELLAMSFASLTEGAHGIIWYTYANSYDSKNKRWNQGPTASPEHWAVFSRVTKWISSLAPVLLERTGAQPNKPEILSGPKSDPFGQHPISFLLKEHNSVRYLLSVNTTLAKVKARFCISGDTAKVQREGRVLPIRDGAFDDEWDPFDVHVYEIR
jgi:hypothetical protein